MVYFDFEPEKRYRSTWIPVIDVCEGPEAFVIRIELAGVAKDDVRLHWSNGVLAITGIKRRQPFEKDGSRYLCLERPYGRFRREIAINARVDFQRARAELRDGLLRVRLPKLLEDREGAFIPIR